jgi:hypothetical protein
MLPLAEIKRINHVTDASVFVKDHVLLHTILLLAHQLILHHVHCCHKPVLKQIL